MGFFKPRSAVSEMREGGLVLCILISLQGILMPTRVRTAEVEPGLSTSHSPHHAPLPIPSPPPSVTLCAVSVGFCVTSGFMLLSYMASGALPSRLAEGTVGHKARRPVLHTHRRRHWGTARDSGPAHKAKSHRAAPKTPRTKTQEEPKRGM